MKNKLIPFVLTSIMIMSFFFMGGFGYSTAKADPATKCYTVTISGMQDLSAFPETYYYNDGVYEGTLNRGSDFTISIRETFHYSTTQTKDLWFALDMGINPSDFLPSFIAVTYRDDEANQEITKTVPLVGSEWVNKKNMKQVYTHYGYDYNIDNSCMGWMSNNDEFYYVGDDFHLFSAPPALPDDLYITGGDGWVLDYCIWDDDIQSATREPSASVLYSLYGFYDFRSDTGKFNHYRKPVQIGYSRYVDQYQPQGTYELSLPFYKTEVIYTGCVTMIND